MDYLYDIVGIKLTHVAAGVAGGLVKAFYTGGSLMQAVTNVVVGTLTAAYLTTPVYFMALKYAPWEIPGEPSTEHAIGFIVGFTAMLVCEALTKQATALKDKFLGKKEEGDDGQQRQPTRPKE